MHLLYSAIIYFSGFILQMAAFINPKAKLWIEGRKEWGKQLKKAIREKTTDGDSIAWFHASSLGEFEQGRPVLEAYKEAHPEVKILLTFFSPSGFEIRKNYEKADLVFYLPLDTPYNARILVNMVKPSVAFFIKYDYWYNFLIELKEQKIPVYFISAAFRKNQHFFQWYGTWFRRQLSAIDWFFVQNESSQQLLSSIGYNNASVSGDTRFDRVYTIARMKQEFPLVRKFCGDGRVFIGGSTWKEDEAVITPLIHAGIPGLKFILAPHDTSSGRVQSLVSRIGKPVLLYTDLKESNATDSDILIINTVGVLNQLYQYTSLAFIGGGYSGGIHNIQEPITFGVPVFFGPKYRKFREAVDLVARGGAFCVTDAESLKTKVMELLESPSLHRNVSSLCLQYVEENRGATGKIMAFFQNHE